MSTTDRPSPGIGMFIGLVACVCSVALYASAPGLWRALGDDPTKLALFLVVPIVLQAASIDVYRRGQVSVAGIGFLAVGISCGVGAAMVAAFAAAAVHAAHKRPKAYKAVFNASTFALAAAAGTVVYRLLAGPASPTLDQLVASAAAGVAFTAVNLGLLAVVMSLASGQSPAQVWRESLGWLTPHYVAFGPLALAAVAAYDKVGVAGLAAFALPPALMTFSVHQYVNRTRDSVEDVREANRLLEEANADLAARNEDLADLLTFSRSLTAHAHDRDALARVSGRALSELFRGPVVVDLSPDAVGQPLLVRSDRVGGISVPAAGGFDSDRWDRLSAILLPHLATAAESASLVDEVRKRHLSTISALSRSMEAKDNYTGGHVERVSEVAIALARRLGYEGDDLDAIEVGAVLHDIGKIGIPERIIQKPGPLDDEEWAVMKQHPLISEHILTGCGLSPIVLQIARSSHERMDGKGYPDGLAGEKIPMPARIVLVADAFDALTSDRSYRKGRSVPAALEEICAHSGTQFCPRVVAALEAVYREQPAILGVTRLQAVSAA